MSEIDLKKGVAINFIAKYSNIVIQLIITAILARLLTPKEYGIISIIMIFITFFGLIGEMGIGPAIIQYKDLSDDDISSIFIFTFFIAVALSMIFFAFSYLISYIYNSEVYISIGHLLCITIIFNVINIVPNGLQLKNKNFKIIGITGIVTNIISGIITIILAFLGFSYYSLILNSIIQSVLNFLILFHFSYIKIKIRKFSLNPIKRISHYSIFQFLFNFINYFSRNSDNLLIGKFLGMNPLGFYDKAYKLMLYPVQNLTFVITPVLQPVLSDYKDDKEIILLQYKKIVKLLALIGAFISVFCFFSSKEIILIMFGKQWAGSIESFRFLSISIVIQMVLSSSGSIFQATGYTNYLFITGLINSITIILLILFGIFLRNINYISFFISIGFLLNFFVSYFILIKKVFKSNYFDYLKEFKSSILIMVLMIIVYSLFKINLNNYLLSIIFKLLIGFITYLIGLYITKEIFFLKKIFIKKI